MKRLFRDRWDKKIGGVCGGLGHFLRIDPTIIRLFFVILCMLTVGIPLFIYVLAWILIPLGPTTYIQINCTRLYRSVKDRKVSGICGGISELIHVDSTLIRIVFVVALFLTGGFPLLIAYLIGTAIIPQNPNR